MHWSGMRSACPLPSWQIVIGAGTFSVGSDSLMLGFAESGANEEVLAADARLSSGPKRLIGLAAEKLNTDRTEQSIPAMWNCFRRSM